MFINEQEKSINEVIKEILNSPNLSDDAKTKAIQALKQENNIVEGLEEGEVLIEG